MQRLDIYLAQSGFCQTRSKASQLIKEGKVMVNEKTITKAGCLILGTEKIDIKDSCPFVSRAGQKLFGAIKDFGLNFDGKIVLDIGSSTGGFTDCALQNGAKKVYALDVGTSQLNSRLRNDKRVVVMENTDIRSLDKSKVSDINLIVCDVSFISLTKISYKISELLPTLGEFVVLIKPQFECGKTIAKKSKGVIKDEKIHKKVRKIIQNDFILHNLQILSIKTSSIKGTDGNIEFVAHGKKVSNLF